MEVIKRKFPSERSQAKASNRSFQSGRSQTDVPKRQIPRGSPSWPAHAGRGFQAKDSERLQVKDLHRKVSSDKIQTGETLGWRSRLDVSKRTIPKGSKWQIPSKRFKEKEQAKDPAT